MAEARQGAGSSIKIRRLRTADIGGVLELVESVAAERIHIATEPGFDQTRYRQRMKVSIHNEAEPIFVAIVGKQVVGQLSIRDNHQFGPSLGMMVDAEYRRRGIGRNLMRATLDWARRRGVSSLSLRVFPHNRAALELYQKFGFRIIERLERDVPRANGEVWDSILMQADLS